MASVFLLIVYLSTILFFVPIQSNIIEQLREKRKRRNINNNIAEFDVNQTNNLGDKLETQLGRSYEYLGHKMVDLGTKLEENKDNLAEKATEIYKGPFADRTGVVYENLQNGYGSIGDRLSSILNWLGVNVINAGHRTSSLIRSSFHTLGNLIGDTIDRTEQFVGNGLVRTSQKVHQSAIDLQSSSHNNSELLRHKLQQSAPQIEHSLTNTLNKLGSKLHRIGLDTELAGEVIEKHHFLDTMKQAYNN